MKRAISILLLLAPALAFSQKFEDLTSKGAPVSLSIQHDRKDLGPYVAIENTSGKTILAYIAVTKTTDARGETKSCTSRGDYVFSSRVLASREHTPLPCPMEPATNGAKVTDVVGTILFVQFEDGTAWGELGGPAKEMLSERPKRLAFLTHLVETYYESGEDAFNNVLNNPKSEDWLFAILLKDRDTPPIDLAKKQLAAAQGWRASGIF